MNREILFRGKRADNGEWVYGYLYIHNGYSGTSALIRGDKILDTEVDIKTIGQYTGLTDKNGKKIFEGDIIRLDDEERKLISRAGSKTEEELCRRDCLVGFKDGSFMFGRNKLQLDYFDSYLWLTNQYCEVIGNIFDKEVNQ